jgi:hypothetical protein
VDDVIVVLLHTFCQLSVKLKHPIKFYGMASFERFVNSSTLNVVVPNEVLEFPPQDIDYSVWVRKLVSDKVERKRAFFGISYGMLFCYLVLLIH